MTDSPNQTPTRDHPKHGGRKLRFALAAAVLMDLGLLGGVLITVASDATAHGKWRGAWGKGDHGHQALRSPAEAAELVQHAAAWMLGKVDATGAQREQIDGVLADFVDEVYPLAEQHRESHRDLITELSRPQVDAQALEDLRQTQLALADTVSARLLDAVVEISDVLDAEQRQALIERMGRYHH